MRTPTAVSRMTVVAALPLALTALALTACGSSDSGSTAYGTSQRTITIDVGQDFTLEVPASSAMGENWYLADPKPDPGVLDHGGKREDTDAGDDGMEYFDFTGVKAGRATVKLLHCPNGFCHGADEVTASPAPSGAPAASPVPTATGAPDDRVEYFVYEITVR
ncbi:protease inhibitor I42 family protein [Streptomyces lincolnensis]|uniref:protease inhibitor I42 family protein n=1 Tax=Streptomyces lincolnensis TaxID=1915 RepID=UPI001E40437D|nr:protease inhibitor I42 family protein [Streptomyces lincolnensis]MCD7441453.1 protease inhibitor I42 family protein [Streptomyces lincolnensis]